MGGEIQPLEKKHICIIDDDPDILIMYRLRFEQDGYYVSVAVNGEEGLSLVRSVLPDVIILDLQMPQMDGISVLSELNRDPELAHTPVIILSNNNSDQMFQKITELGTVRYYIVKTLTTPKKVVEIVTEVLMNDSEIEK